MRISIASFGGPEGPLEATMKRSRIKRSILCASSIAVGISLFVFSQSQIQVGYSLLSTDSGTRIPVGTALFSYTNSSGILVSQAGVGGKEPISSGCIFVDQDGTETGIALVNPSSQAATATLTLRTASGQVFGRQSLALGSKQHVARFVSDRDLFPGMPAGFTGSLSFECNEKLAAVTLRQSQNAHPGEVLYTTLPVVDLSQAASGEPVVFPQVAAGEGYATQLILINSTDQTQRGQVSLYGDDGSRLPLKVAGTESSQFVFEIVGHGVYRVELDAESGIRAGYAVVTPEPGSTAPSGSAVFRYKKDNSIVTEAGIGATSPTTLARIFVDNVDSYTGVALVNRENQASTVRFVLLDRTGLVLETTSRTLAAGGHLAVFTHELFPERSKRFTGLMEIASATPVAAITLKLVINERGDLIYTSLPVADLNKPPSATTMVFPQIVIGEGFSTRLILINTDNARAASGQLTFYQSSSSPMTIPFGNQVGSQFSYQLPQGGGIQFFPGNTAKIASIALLDPQTDRVTSEVTVNEGNIVKAPLLVLDETGTPRDDFVLNYASISPDVATVNANGYITGNKAGFSTLTVSGSGVVTAGTITVVKADAGVSGFEISGITQDLAQRIYLAATQQHTILLAQDLKTSPEVYAGKSQQAGLKNDIRKESLFRNPAYLAINQAEASLYVSDGANHVIRKVQAGPAGKVETFGGIGTAGSTDGPRQQATFNNPQGVALDYQGNLWIADTGNHTIRRISRATGMVETIAGKAGISGFADGRKDQAKFSTPVGIAIESETTAQQLERQIKGLPPPPVSVIVADSGNGLIRRVKETGEVETIGSPSLSAPAGGKKKLEISAGPIVFKSPAGVAVDPFGNIYVSEADTGRLKTILQNGTVVSAAQEGTFASPRGVAITQSGKIIVADGKNTAREITYGEPQISSITPEKAGARGGEKVTIKGSNFSAESIVVIAGTVINQVTVKDTRTIEFTVPAQLPSGLGTLTVQNRSGLVQRQFLVETIPLDQLPAGYITTYAGGSTFAGDGTLATNASLKIPAATAVDSSGNLYIADEYNARVRKVALGTGIITSVAGTGVSDFSGDGGPATAATLAGPEGLAIDSAGNLFIADSDNNCIRKVAVDTGIITTVAGTTEWGFGGDGGPATAATLAYPQGLAIDSEGNLFIADSNNNCIRKVAAQTGIITTVAGTGREGFGGDGRGATAALLATPSGVALDSAGNLFIADYGNDRIRKVAAGTGIITTVAGSDDWGFKGDGSPATAATLYYPSGVALDVAGNLFIADMNNRRIRKVAADSGIITTVAGTGEKGFGGDGGPATAAEFFGVVGVYVDSSGNLFIADSNNDRIRKVSAITGIITTVAGITNSEFIQYQGPAIAARLYVPYDVTTDSVGNVYIADSGNNRICKVAVDTGIITTVAGDGQYDFSGDNGPATAASLRFPTGVAVDSAGNIFIADEYNQRIRKVTTATGVITTVAGTGKEGFGGDGGPAAAARLDLPRSVAVDSAGNIFIIDLNNNRIRKVAAGTGIITTVAGTGQWGFGGDGGPATAAKLKLWSGVAVDSSDNIIFADTDNNRIRKVAAGTGIITTVVGTGEEAFGGDGGPATAATMDLPTGVALDSAGNIFIADEYNQRVRKVAAATGIITTVAGTGEEGAPIDGSLATATRLYKPHGLAMDRRGYLFLADFRHHRIRVIRGPIP
jgi:sugar lactone lactonase YvrE